MSLRSTFSQSERSTKVNAMGCGQLPKNELPRWSSYMTRQDVCFSVQSSSRVIFFIIIYNEQCHHTAVARKVHIIVGECWSCLPTNETVGLDMYSLPSDGKWYPHPLLNSESTCVKQSSHSERKT